MAHPYIDQAYIDAHISVATRQALGLSTSDLAILIEGADTDTDRTIDRWGYDPPDATIPTDVKELSLGAFLFRAFDGRHGVDLTKRERDLVDRHAKEWDRVMGLTPRTEDAPGGHVTADDDPLTGSPQVFTHDALYRGRW